MLLGLIDEVTGIAAQILTSVSVNLEQTQLEVEKNIGRGKGTPKDIPFTSKATRVLDLSLKQARQLNHNYIGTEHLLLGILCEEGGLAIQVLKNLGIDLQNLEQQTRDRLEPGTSN